MKRANLAQNLIRGIGEGRIRPESLTAHERKLCTQTLRVETDWTQHKIAQFLSVSRATIIKYCREINAGAMRGFAPYNTQRIADWMLAQYEELRERARRKGDGWLEFKLISDAVEKLGKMGYIHFKGDPVNIQIGDKTEYHHTNNIQVADLPAEPEARDRAIKQTVAEIELLQRILNREGSKE